MNNSIDPRLNGGLHHLAEQSKPGQGKPNDATARGQDTTKAHQADQLNLTDKARSLKALEVHIHDAPEVDNQRVSELKQVIKDGKYEINPARIADKLLALDALLPK